MRKHVAFGFVLTLAWATAVLAADAPKKGIQATGTFVSAQLAGDVVKWEVDLGADAGKKTFEMTADVQVAYTEKDGAKQATGIRSAKGREFKAQEGVTVAKGKFASAKVEGDSVLVTITPTEGDKALEVKLPKQVSVRYTEAEGKLVAMSIGVPRPPK